MVRDRLAELHKICDLNIAKEETILEMNGDSSSTNQIFNVLDEYSEIRDWIEQIRNNIQSMRNVLAEIQTTFQTSKTRSLPEEMDKLRQLNITICQKIYTKMKDLEKDLPFKDDYLIVSRIRRTNFYCVREDFINTWREHEQFLVNYEEKVKKSLMRHAKIVDVNITEDETEELIATNKTSLFVGNILEETENARQALRDLLVRHSELQKLERSITEVRDMFLRISTLVMEQSELIQIVEYHAQQATMNIDKGAEELEKARDLKIKYYKKKTCILIWVAVILSVLLFLLFVL